MKIKNCYGVTLHMFKGFDYEKFWVLYQQKTEGLVRTSTESIVKTKCKYLQDCIIRLSVTNDEGFSLHSQVLKSVVGREYRQMLDCMIEMHLIKYKNCKAQRYKVGEYATQYAISDKVEFETRHLINRKIKEYKDKTRNLLKQMKEDTTYRYMDSLYGKGFRKKYLSSLRKITIENSEGFDVYVKKVISENPNKEPYYTYIKEELLNRDKDINSIDYYSGAGRIYHILTNTDRNIKKYLNIEVMLDAANSQPLLFCYMIFRFYDINEEASYHIISSLKDIKEHPNTPLYNVGNNLRNILIQSNIEKQDVEKMSNDVLLYIFLTVKGLLWDVISMNKGLPREKVKTTMFQQVFYSNSGYAYRWKEWAVEFETMFPNVYSIIGRWKEKLRPKEVEEYISKYNICPNKPTAALSIAMQNLESRIMSTILKRMYERKWYAVNLHDCIIVPKTGDSTESPSIDQLKHLMDDVYKQFGLAATFR